MVLTPTGERAIETLKVGGWVCSKEEVLDPPNENVAHRIRAVRKYPISCIQSLKLTTGEEIRSTGHHNFSTSRGWKRLEQLTEEDSLFIVQDGIPRLVRIETINRNVASEEVWNLIVDGPATFIASGAIVSSFTTLRWARTILGRMTSSSHLTDFRYSPSANT
jgi:hypothetical protein